MSSVSDLLVHLRPCPIVVEFNGATFTIPAQDAVTWVALIDGNDPDLYDIFPGLAGQEAIEAVEDALWEGQVTSEQVGRLALEIIGVAADRPWWVALRIIGSAAQAWGAVHVNQAASMSLAGWLDEIWSKIMERVDPAKRAGWISGIEQAPKGEESEVDFDAEEQAFLAAMKAASG